MSFNCSFAIFLMKLILKDSLTNFVKVLGALLTHVGSGIYYEVSAALDTLVKLASRKSQELTSLSSHLTGIYFILLCNGNQNYMKFSIQFL